MTLYIHTPYSTERNLGKAYNEFMELLPDDTAACFIDGDVCFLTPDYGHILHTYANEYPNNVLTCYTNRIHQLSTGQQCNVCIQGGNDDIASNIRRAELIRDSQDSVTAITGPVSGFLLVVPKSIWRRFKFTEENYYKPGQPNLLGVDNKFTNDVRAAGIQVLRMNKLFVWHSYRLLTGSKSHLQ